MVHSSSTDIFSNRKFLCYCFTNIYTNTLVTTALSRDSSIVFTWLGVCVMGIGGTF